MLQRFNLLNWSTARFASEVRFLEAKLIDLTPPLTPLGVQLYNEITCWDSKPPIPKRLHYQRVTRK